jgi:hypothetical protein
MQLSCKKRLFEKETGDKNEVFAGVWYSVYD